MGEEGSLGRPNKICWQRRQDFIDCMFVHSRCVQSGQLSFQQCLDRDRDEGTVHEDCKRRWREWMRCREQMVDTRTRFRGFRDH